MSEPLTSFGTYIYVSQREKLKAINKKTRIPMSELIREGLDLVFEKRKQDLDDGTTSPVV